MSNIRVKTYLNGTSEYLDSNQIVSNNAFVDNLIVYDQNVKAVGDVGYFQFELSDGTITRSYFATYLSDVGLAQDGTETTASTGNTWSKYTLSLSNVMTHNANGVKINSSVMWTFSVVCSDANDNMHIRNTFSNVLSVGASIPVSISESIATTLEQELRAEMSAITSQIKGTSGKVFVGNGTNDATWETLLLNGKALNDATSGGTIYAPTYAGANGQMVKSYGTDANPDWFTPVKINDVAFSSTTGTIYAPTSSPSSTKAFLRSNGGATPQWAEMEITSNSTTSEKTYTIKLGQQVIGTIVYPINSGIWGNITGTLSNQTDLQQALNGKQNTLVSGANIKTINNTSIVGSGNIDVIAKKPDGTNDLITQNNKIATSYLPDTIVGQLVYKGTFNDVDDLPSPSLENKGWYYVFNGASPSGSYVMGDWAVSNGTTYDKIDNTDAVQSVCGKTGSVSLGTSDITGLQLALDTKQPTLILDDTIEWKSGTTLKPIGVGDTIKKVWFDTEYVEGGTGSGRTKDLELASITYEDGMAYLFTSGVSIHLIAVKLAEAGYPVNGYGLLTFSTNGWKWVYSNVEFTDSMLSSESVSVGWQNLTNGYFTFPTTAEITSAQTSAISSWCKYVEFNTLGVSDEFIAEIEAIVDLVEDKQDELVSGTNIKTINSQSVLGGGNLELFTLASDSDYTSYMEA